MTRNKYFIFFAIILVILSAGCLSYQSGGNWKKTAPSMSYDSYELNYELKDAINEEFADTASEKGKNTQLYGDRKIISTANLQIEVESVQTAFNDIKKIIEDSGGFISSSSTYDLGGRYNGRMTVRVPQKNFYPALERFETVGKVRSKDISGQDVTEEYIDLKARLGNLEKQETRLQEILGMAVTVEEILKVEKELERVRGEIERLTGRLNYLDKNIEMSTITVSMAEPAPIGGDGWGITDALREAASGFINTILAIIVFVGYVIPVVVFIVSVILIALGVKRKLLPRLKL
jgi:hypothetical protein